MASYFVKNGGSDAADGLSDANAWATVAKVNSSSFSAGDRISFKCGSLWREKLVIPSSGSAGSPITVGAYGSGAAPLLKGSNVMGGWVADVGVAYRTALAGDPGFIVAEDDVILSKRASAAAVGSNPGSFFWSAGTLYVSASDSSNPNSNGKVYEAAVRDNVAWISSKNYVTYENLEVAHSTEAGLGGENNCSHMVISSCVGRQCNWMGLNIAGSDGLLIDSVGYENKTYAGIGVQSSGGTTTVSNCTSYDNGTDWWQDHGFYVDALTGAAAIIVRDCVAHDNMAHGFKGVVSITTGTMTFLRCVSYDNGHSGLFVDSGNTVCRFYQCVSDGNANGLDVYDSTAVVVAAENNILSNSQYDNTNDPTHSLTGRGIFNNGGTITTCDYNCIFGNQVARTGQAAGAHDVTGDPDFSNRTWHVYTLGEGSSCLDAGIYIPGINDGYTGSAPDIGAFETEAAFGVLVATWGAVRNR